MVIDMNLLIFPSCNVMWITAVVEGNVDFFFFGSEEELEKKRRTEGFKRPRNCTRAEGVE